jgi:hypothetical protein
VGNVVQSYTEQVIRKDEREKVLDVLHEWTDAHIEIAGDDGDYVIQSVFFEVHKKIKELRKGGE